MYQFPVPTLEDFLKVSII